MKICSKTHVGKVRASNEDYVAYNQISSSECVLALCDGVSGCAGGEIAAQIAAKAFISYATNELNNGSTDIFALADKACAYANFCVLKKMHQSPELRGMSSTIVAAIIKDSTAAIVHLGDSRCYWMAEGVLTQITKDHSYVQELYETGKLDSEEISSHPKKSYITKAIGLSSALRGDVYRVDLYPQDILMLCCDGLYNMVSHQTMESVLNSQNTLEEKTEQLLSYALQSVASDNISVILFTMEGDDSNS